jgi:hypothetical protein
MVNSVPALCGYSGIGPKAPQHGHRICHAVTRNGHVSAIIELFIGLKKKWAEKKAPE